MGFLAHALLKISVPAAAVCISLLAAEGRAAPQTIRPGAVWQDDSGRPVQAHGGGVILSGDTYYWFGEDRTPGLDPSKRYVACYSSHDLAHWKFCNRVLQLGDPEGLGPTRILERPKVFFSKKTGMYVMYVHIDGPEPGRKGDYNLARVGVAVCEKIDGDYRFLKSFRPLGHESRDIGQFVDDDGTAYLIFEDRPFGFRIAKLAADCLSVEREVCLVPEHLEGGAIVHYDGLYYVIGSQLTGWDPNPNKYATAVRLEGPWSEFRDIAPPSTKTFGAQSTLLLKVTGTKATTVIFMGDLWKPDALWDSRYCWMPLEIGHGNLALPQPREWSLDVQTGEATLAAANVSIEVSAGGRKQIIDGFGTCIGDAEARQAWWQAAYLDDLGASILRVDLTPHFKSPWSDLNFFSPWMLGQGEPPYAFNFNITPAERPRYYVGTPGNPNAMEFTNGKYNGPEGTRVRTYSSAADYGKTFGNRNAPIAVMGPSIDDNIARYFDLAADYTITANAIISAAKSRDPSLSRFKLIGSIWSPAPWLKVSSGSVTPGAEWPLQPAGVRNPHIWNGNFTGGRLDVSEAPVGEFDDSALPGDPGGPNRAAPRGKTSALTQFARCTAAYLRALQHQYGTRFYAISIQNELNFETFYSSCVYPLSADYIAALKYVRAELDKYDDLRGIRIMGPEDLLSDSTYSLWQYGSGAATIHKNLQLMEAVAADPAAAAALSFFCIHGYAADGVAAAGADPVGWERWANGWKASPAGGMPALAKGFCGYGKKSWMTETSGEGSDWGTVTSNGAFSIAVKIHQALTAGQESAWLYWQMTDSPTVGGFGLTDSKQRGHATKFTALRHFSRFIRPGSQRVAAAVTGPSTLLASAFVNDNDQTLAVVLVNTAASPTAVSIQVPAMPWPIAEFSTAMSSKDDLWQTGATGVAGGAALVTVPGNGIVSLISSPK